MIVHTSLPHVNPGTQALFFAVCLSGLINYPVYLVIVVLCILYSMYWFSQTLISCALDTEGMVLRVSPWLCPWRSRTLNVLPGDKITLTVVKFSVKLDPLLFPISTKRHKHLCVISSSYHFLLELAQNGNYLILLLLALRAPRGDKKVEGRV
jgi:hypothetical protein